LKKILIWSSWSPMRRGSLLGVAVTVGLGLSLWPIGAAVAEKPSAELLRYMAGIGATLLIAYAIEMSAVVRTEYVRSSMRENWIGFIVGIGVGGLMAVAVALGLAERAEVNHRLWVDQALFAFATGGLLMLGLIVTLLPALHYEWLRPAPPTDD
jgi:hypothetical protein